MSAAAIAPRGIGLTTGASHFSPEMRRVELPSFKALAEHVNAMPRASAESKGRGDPLPWFSPAQFDTSTKRKGQSPEWTCLVLDFDGCAPPASIEQYSRVQYKTRSSTAERPSWRVAIELDRPAAHAEIVSLASRFEGCDPGALKTTQLFFAPGVGKVATYHAGEVLRVDAVELSVAEIKAHGVDAGARHAALLKVAADARHRGAGEAEILAEMRAVNARFRPPQDDADLLRIAGDYALKDAGSPPAAPSDFPNVEQPRTLRQASLDDLATVEPPEPRFVVEQLMPRGFVTLLSGHGGAGKSLLSLAIAACIATGSALGPFKCEKGRALVLSLEDNGDLVKLRLRRVAEALGLDVAEVARRVTVLTGEDAALVEERDYVLCKLPALAELRELATGHDLIIVDNASDAFSANENNRRLVRKFVRGMLQPIAASNDAALLLLVHVDKAGVRHGTAGESYSGSTAWHNSARSRLALAINGDKLELRHEKSNLGPPAEPVILERAAHGVIRPLSGAQREALYNADADLTVDAIAKSTADVPTATRGNRTAWHVLEALLPEKWDSRRLRDALIKAERLGLIQREPYLTAHRHQSERWAVTLETLIGEVQP